VLEKIIKSGKQTLSRRDIQRLCRRFEKAQDFIPSLEILEDYGYIKSFIQEPANAWNKPNVIYKINPNVTDVTNVTE